MVMMTAGDLQFRWAATVPFLGVLQPLKTTTLRPLGCVHNYFGTVQRLPSLRIPHV